MAALCFTASVSRAQTVEEFPRGPWTVVTFHHLLVKINNAYARFIVKSLPPFASSNDLLGSLRVVHLMESSV